jgi:D-alanyl-D-alanine carboxypeptidase
VDKFIAAHETVFVIEQNRDAQLRTLITTEQEVNPAKLEPILHYDGTPITARFITAAIATHADAHKVAPIKKGQEVAQLVITTSDTPPQVVPLVAGEDVGKAGFFGRMWLGLKSLFGMA